MPETISERIEGIKASRVAKRIIAREGIADKVEAVSYMGQQEGVEMLKLFWRDNTEGYLNYAQGKQGTRYEIMVEKDGEQEPTIQGRL